MSSFNRPLEAIVNENENITFKKNLISNISEEHIVLQSTARPLVRTR